LPVSAEKAAEVAKADAKAAYGDVTEFEIDVSLQQDGWHVDFRLKKEHLNGGGPHYLIDPRSGRIKWKRYDQ